MSTEAKQHFLIRVPDYISEQWNRVLNDQSRGEVGQLELTKFDGGEEWNLLVNIPDAPNRIPLKLKPVAHTSVVFSEEAPIQARQRGMDPAMPGAGRANPSHSAPHPDLAAQITRGAYRLEGETAIQMEGRLDPATNAEHRAFVNQRIAMKQDEQQRKIRKIDVSSVPISTTPSLAKMREQNKKAEKEKPAKKLKAVREDEQVLIERLFNLFREQEHYSLTELERITEQPRKYLSDVLSKIAVKKGQGESAHLYSLKDQFLEHP